jgi:hypothetical protein
MHQFHVRAAAVILAIAVGSSAALAQSSSGSSTTTTISSTASEVKDWTRKKWNAMKREWQKDKAKWDACNQKSSDKKLKGKASWSFIYDCMTA